MKHTPEPWAVLLHAPNVVFVMAGGYAKGTAPASAATPAVACCDRYCHGTADEVQANAARIVACVNACAGLDVSKVKALLDAVRAWAQKSDGDNMMRSMAAEQALVDSIRAAKGVGNAT